MSSGHAVKRNPLHPLGDNNARSICSANPSGSSENIVKFCFQMFVSYIDVTH